MVSTYEGIYEVIVSRLQQILRKIVFSKLFTKKIKKKQKYMSYGLSKVNDFPYFSMKLENYGIYNTHLLIFINTHLVSNEIK